jgi:membrane protease YdiL (CAAX protease family)
VDWRAASATGRRSWLVVVAIVAVVIVVVAVHAGLVGVALRSGWSLAALTLVGAALAAKAALVVVAGRRGHRIHLRHRRQPPPETH